MAKISRRPLLAKPPSSLSRSHGLFDRIVAILEQARGNVVRAVNTNMVTAYWLIGREIVEEMQKGKRRAGYGEKIIEDLSIRLTERFGQGFSATNLWYFRQFYLTYPDRVQILRPMGGDSQSNGILHPVGGELVSPDKTCPAGTQASASSIRNLSAEQTDTARTPVPSLGKAPQGFSPQLSWTHYRILMGVKNRSARDFYEQQAIAGGWDKRTLERQIHSFYYERTLKSQNPSKMSREGHQIPVPSHAVADELKNPYVLEFLGLPEVAALQETDLEQAVITHLQKFLLELGNGFAFVARQKHIRMGEQDRYIDLVFYHCRLKFYLLIDLKIGELTHADVGQMDGYVRMYDELAAAPDDNPTIGLILCTEKNDAVARYSVLKDRKQIFASKYMLFLPTEEQLRQEIKKEIALIKASKPAIPYFVGTADGRQWKKNGSAKHIRPMGDADG